MADLRSWDLKVERAKHHLDEVKAKMAAYAARNPFRATRVRQPRGQRHIWLYRLEMTEKPDPVIPVIIGECLYDLRSALDHLAVAMAPRNRKASAAFPVEWTDPWEKDAAGNVIYAKERRRSFTSEATFIALAGAEVVGFAKLSLTAPTAAGNAMTAVKRAWRGRGIAGALKATEINWALANGYTELHTSNEERNAPINRLNARLGYRPGIGRIHLVGPILR